MAVTRPYGCHDKQHKKGYYVVQRRYVAFGQYVMEPTYIAHTMTTDCQWSKTHKDTRCDGCSRRAVEQPTGGSPVA